MPRLESLWLSLILSHPDHQIDEFVSYIFLIFVPILDVSILAALMWGLVTAHVEVSTDLLTGLTPILSGPSSIEWSNIDSASYKALPCYKALITWPLPTTQACFPVTFFEVHCLKLPNILCFWAFLLCLLHGFLFLTSLLHLFNLFSFFKSPLPQLPQDIPVVLQHGPLAECNYKT